MSKIKALILDAGGVLVHPIHGDWNIPVKYREYLGACADDIPGEKWLEACRAEAQYLREDVFIKDMREEFNLRLKFLIAVDKRMGWNLSSDALWELATDFTYNADRYEWFDDVIPWFSRWQGSLRLGILSDAMPSFRDVAQKHASFQYVEKLVISTEVGVTKPDARMYNEICRCMRIRPEDCLFVDDKVCNLEGAMACGMRAVQMCRDGLIGWDGDKVHDLTELNSYVEGLN